MCISIAKETCLLSHCLAMAVSSGSAICCYVFTAPLLSSGRFLLPVFRLSVVMSQYYGRCKLYTVCVRVCPMHACMCTIHQHVKLMLEACRISKVTTSNQHYPSAYQQSLNYNMICHPPQTNCFSMSAVNVQDLPI
jgi:hypothetical protein